MSNHRFKELLVWQKAIAHVCAIYKATAAFPAEEIYGLRSQLCRCAVSVPSNIAEGSGRGSAKDFVRFLGIALSSCYEMETQLIISKNLELIDSDLAEDLISKTQELQKMIYSFKRSIIAENDK